MPRSRAAKKPRRAAGTSGTELVPVTIIDDDVPE
jgi:hypothetical protein